MYIGIDLGTSSVKLILVSSTGVIHKTISKSYDLHMPYPTWSEQHPIDWYNQTIEGLIELVQGYEKEIKAISFSGQMHGMVILDAYDEVIRPAILWNDQRTTEEVSYLNDVVGMQKILQETGNIALTGLTAPKLLWVKKHEPALFSRISKVMLPKDYLIYRLSGVFATDESDVSGTLYYDVEHKKYSSFMLDILNLRIEQCPKVYESFQTVGTIKQSLAKELGLLPSVKIVAGGGDQAVGAIGTGIVNDGECSVSLGTSGVVFVASNAFKVDNISYLQSYVHSNGKYHLMGVMLNAAGSLKWWTEQIFQNYNYQDFFEKLDHVAYDDDLYFLPYLNGERAPINDALARGVFFGLRSDHRKENMDRAVVEGVTFALKQIFDLIIDLGVPINRIRLTGGGAKSPIWAKMIADVMNIEVSTIESEEGPAFGAAILAMVGEGIFVTVEQACQTIIKTKNVYYPNVARHNVYSLKYNFYKSIYPTIKSLFLEQSLYKR